MYCKHCGKEIPDDSAYCKHCGKGLVFTDDAPVKKTVVIETQVKQKNPFIILASIMAAISIVGSVAYYITAIHQSKEMTSAIVSFVLQEGPMTRQKYDKIKNKMSYKQVVKLVGTEGEIMSSYGEGKLNTFVVKWDGYGSVGANAIITFQNNVVVGKAQAGLK